MFRCDMWQRGTRSRRRHVKTKGMTLYAEGLGAQFAASVVKSLFLNGDTLSAKKLVVGLNNQ